GRTERATLVFGRTRHGVRKLAKQLAREGYTAAALQSDMAQNARDRVIAAFRTGEVPILIATNVAARGLDIIDLGRVINYDLPENGALFTHRVGRTGRMGRAGQAITLLAPEDQAKWRQLEKELKAAGLAKPFPRRSWDGPLPDVPARAPSSAAQAPTAHPAQVSPATSSNGRPKGQPARRQPSTPPTPALAQTRRPQRQSDGVLGTPFGTPRRRRPAPPINRSDRPTSPAPSRSARPMGPMAPGASSARVGGGRIAAPASSAVRTPAAAERHGVEQPWQPAPRAPRSPFGPHREPGRRARRSMVTGRES
ncbi:MAG: helicase-related protein, partial [Chloroflexota bacterium]